MRNDTIERVADGQSQDEPRQAQRRRNSRNNEAGGNRDEEEHVANQVPNRQRRPAKPGQVCCTQEKGREE
jgi:hypothetical protein